MARSGAPAAAGQGRLPRRVRLRPWLAALAGGIAGAIVVAAVQPSFLHLRGDPASAQLPPSPSPSLIPGTSGPPGPTGPAGPAVPLATANPGAISGVLSATSPEVATVAGKKVVVPTSPPVAVPALPRPAGAVQELQHPPVAPPPAPIAAPPVPVAPPTTAPDPGFVVPDLPTVVAFAGPSGDWVTQGRRWQYTQANAITVASQPAGCSSFDGPKPVSGGHLTTRVQEATDWTIDLASPSGRALGPGTYSQVDRYPFCNPRFGGFSLWGDGRGCNTLTADFTIRELTLAPDGSVAHLDVRFDQSCEKTMPVSHGVVRYNALLPANP